jgi:hypothetical protein
LDQLLAVTPGLSPKEIIEQSASFIFRDGRVVTFNDEVACSIECKLGISGAVVANPLLALLGRLEEDEVSVEQSGGELLVKSGRRKAGIRMDSEVVLPIDAIEDPKEWRELHSDFLEAIAVVRGCASSNESEFMLTCVHIHPEWIEACDQFQVARYPLATGLKESTLVRSSSLKSVLGLDVKEFSQTANWLHFRNPAGLVLSCRRYSRKYKILDEYLDVDGPKVTLPDGLQEIVNKAQIFSSAGDDGNLITVELRSGKIRLSGRGSNGWYSEVQEMKGYDGDGMKFAIAPSLLIEMSKRASTCKVTLGRLKIQTKKWVCVVCTSVVKDQNNDA